MTDLCCCEYIDRNNERNHILAFCCNCTDLDETVESLVSGRPVSPTNKAGFLATMRDRIRVPWFGGAKLVRTDVALAVISMPVLLIFAAQTLECSVISGIITLALLYNVWKKCASNMPKFHVTWTMTSLIVLYYIYEMIVVPFLFIYLEENIAVSVLTLMAFLCFYKVKHMIIQQRGSILDKSHFCGICEANVQDGSQHIFWIDACVTPRSVLYYFIGLIFTLGSLLYSSNLTLTTVCRPYNVFWTVLLPEDCSDAYQELQ